MIIFQFIPLSDETLMSRLIRSLGEQELPVLDLEDSHWDVFDPHLTLTRKARARALLFDSFCHTPKKMTERPVAIRMNTPGSTEFESDLELAYHLSRSCTLSSIILPKVNTPEQLQHADLMLKSKGVSHGGILPIIETHQGLKNANKLVISAKEVGSSAVIFGYHDYCLEAAWWPFPTPRDDIYWQAVSCIAKPALANGLRYVSPPEPELCDKDLLRELLVRLEDMCGSQFDVMSAGMTQTKIMKQLISELASRSCRPTSPLRTHGQIDDDQKRELAVQLCSAFEENAKSLYSFSVDSKKRRFVSPHEYLAAVRYCRRMDCA